MSSQHKLQKECKLYGIIWDQMHRHCREAGFRVWKTKRWKLLVNKLEAHRRRMDRLD